MIYTQSGFDNLIQKLSSLIRKESWKECLLPLKELEQSIMNKLR